MPTPSTTITAHPVPSGLATLQERFRNWRTRRDRGERIPAELWQAATEQAGLHGLSPTAVALKLSYHDLQRRLQACRAARRGRPDAPVFVEVPAVPLAPGGSERGTIELVQASGARLILRFPAAGPNEVLPVVELFLRSRA
jgi:hypothetical protein